MSSTDIKAMEKARKTLCTFLASKMEMGRRYSSSELKNLIHTDPFLIDLHNRYRHQTSRKGNRITDYSDRWKRFLLTMEKIGYVKVNTKERNYVIIRIR